MEYCKLQIGCMFVVLYICFIYYKEKYRFQMQRKLGLYDVLLAVALTSLIFDTVTAYTVNHLDTVAPAVNLTLHAFFLLSLDAMIFIVFLYLLSATEDYIRDRRKRLLFWIPFAVNIVIVLLNVPLLEFRSGRFSNYSMGAAAYTCFIMAGIYLLLALGIVVRRWNHIQRRKRVSILTCILAVLGITLYQAVFPDTLVTSVATMMIVLGLYTNVEDPAMKELSRYHQEMVRGFATLVESRDSSTGGHVVRTTRYVELLVRSLQRKGCYQTVLTRDYVNDLLLAAPMHDVGKITVPDSILQKPGRLTPEEFEQMKTHTVRGGEIIRESFGRMGDEQYLNTAYEIARHHHEKWNGTGYPDGLRGEAIPLCARIMAVADVFDAVSADRCYRPALPLEECFAIIRQGSGTDFDPLLAEAFLDIRAEVTAVHDGWPDE